MIPSGPDVFFVHYVDDQIYTEICEGIDFLLLLKKTFFLAWNDEFWMILQLLLVRKIIWENVMV